MKRSPARGFFRSKANKSASKVNPLITKKKVFFDPKHLNAPQSGESKLLLRRPKTRKLLPKEIFNSLDFPFVC
jgi:hypothetical protein